MGDTETIIFRMDAKLKRRCEELYEELGFSLEEAAVLFFEKSVEAEGFPLGVCPEYLQDESPSKSGKGRKKRLDFPRYPRRPSREEKEEAEAREALRILKGS